MRHDYTGSCENIIVRPLEIKDIEFLRQWRNDPANTRFLRQIPFITPEMQKSWYERYLDDTSELQFAICFKDSGETIGSCALYNLGVTDADMTVNAPNEMDDSDTNNICAKAKDRLNALTFWDVVDGLEDLNAAESRVMLEAEFGKFMIGASRAHGKHAGTFAVKAIIEIASRQLGLSRLVLHVFKDNQAAVKVYQQAGFKIKDKHIADNGAEEYLMSIELMSIDR